MFRARMATIAAVSLLGMSCSTVATRTQVIVRVEADPGVAADARHLHVVVRAGSNRSTDMFAIRSERDYPDVGPPVFPVEIGLIPADGDVGRVFEVTALAQGDGSPRATLTTARVISGYVAGQTLLVTLRLEDTCRGVMCEATQTCRSGDCFDAFVEPTALAPYGIDAGQSAMDAARDASEGRDVASDVASPDAVLIADTSMDGGAELVEDSGTDVGEAGDASPDAGLDGSLDAETDAGPPPTVCIPSNPTIVVTARRVRGLYNDGYNTTFAATREAVLSTAIPGRPLPSGNVDCAAAPFDALVGQRAVGAQRFLDGSSRPSAGVHRLALEFDPVALPAGARVTGARLVLPRIPGRVTAPSALLDVHAVTFDSTGATPGCVDYSLGRWGAATLGSFRGANMTPAGGLATMALGGPALDRIASGARFELGVRAGADLENIEPGFFSSPSSAATYFITPDCGSSSIDCAPETVALEVDCSFDPPPTCAWDAPFEEVTRVGIDVPGGRQPYGIAVADDERELWIGTAPTGSHALYSLRRPGDIGFLAASALNAGASSNTEPFLTRDGLTLYWSRGPGTAPQDIYTATRPSLGAAFSAPVPVVAINTAMPEQTPWVTARGMYFTRLDGSSNHIYFAPREGSTFGTPVLLPLGAGSEQAWPVVSDDELTVYYGEEIPGRNKELYVAHRDDVRSPFGTPIPIAGVPTTPGENDVPSWISPDQCRMYLVADNQMYVASRRPTPRVLAPCWEPMSSSGAPPAADNSYGSPAAWTGSEFMTWGGETGVSGTGRTTGGTYDPGTDRWMLAPTAGAPTPRTRHTVVWTGTEYIVWGGVSDTGALLGDGGRWNPTAGWRGMSTVGAPSARAYTRAVWTGTHMVVWGGGDNSGGPRFATGGRYDPARDEWSSIATTGSPAPRGNHVMVWTGSRVFVWGGDASVGAVAAGGALYDPVGDRWEALGTAAVPASRTTSFFAWSGREVLIWGGYGASGRLADGAVWNALTNTWRPMSPSGLSARHAGVGAWLGERFVVWGGNVLGNRVTAGGAAYDPVRDRWVALPTAGEPSARMGSSYAATPDALVIWSGSEDTGTVPTGRVMRAFCTGP